MEPPPPTIQSRIWSIGSMPTTSAATRSFTFATARLLPFWWPQWGKGCWRNLRSESLPIDVSNGIGGGRRLPPRFLDWVRLALTCWVCLEVWRRSCLVWERRSYCLRSSRPQIQCCSTSTAWSTRICCVDKTYSHTMIFQNLIYL